MAVNLTEFYQQASQTIQPIKFKLISEDLLTDMITLQLLGTHYVVSGTAQEFMQIPDIISHLNSLDAARIGFIAGLAQSK